jgi:hypothetical protein
MKAFHNFKSVTQALALPTDCPAGSVPLEERGQGADTQESATQSHHLHSSDGGNILLPTL